jgi:enoyl-CoA hydratase/carnithine racemase
MSSSPHILVERRGHVGILVINRPEKRNAFTVEMLRSLTDHLSAFEADADIRVSLVRAEGPDFTTGLDLADVVPSFSQGQRPFADTMTDPWDVVGRPRSKPLVVAARGRCYTLGFELVLAADCSVVASDTVFALREVRVGIIPFGGGVVRLLEAVGWSTTLRYALTGDDMTAPDAHDLHLVQEVVEPGRELERALALAEAIASQPPLAVRALLDHAREALELGRRAALSHVPARGRALLSTDDAREAAAALLERRRSVYHGR